MKINEILFEGVLGGLAGAVKGIAKGVKDIPGQAVAGYKAAATPEITPAAGYRAGAVQSKTPGAQYVSDIGAAIRAGAAGDIGYKQSTNVQSSFAPVGTTISQWKKTANGWINSNNNTAANPTQAATLEKEWTKFSQKAAQTKKQQQSVPPSWDPKKKILTHHGNQYKKTAKGWMDIATDEMIDPKYANEIQTAFDQASGRVPVQTDNANDEMVQLVGTVTTPKGIRANKWSDGKWTTPDEEGKEGYVVDSDVPHLNQLLKQQRPHTGGKRPGVLSQTPDAIRQRQARAAKKQPAVFTSNRPA